MSAPYGTRPNVVDQGDPAQASTLGVSSRVIRLDPGLFALSLMPAPSDRGTGVPSVRVSLPPGPAGRREAVTISPSRSDGWMEAQDEPTLLRVPSGGAEVMVTLYWSAADPTPPALKLVR